MDGRYGINFIRCVGTPTVIYGMKMRKQPDEWSPVTTRLSKEHVTRTARTGQRPRTLVHVCYDHGGSTMSDYKFAAHSISTEHRIPTDELSLVSLPLALVSCYLANQNFTWAFSRLLSFLLPDRIARYIFPTTPPISTDGSPGPRQSHFESEKRVSSLVSSLDKRTSHVPCLQLLLTV